MLCFSIANEKGSFESIEKKWKPEFDQHAPNMPIILVGMKKDLRENEQVIRKAVEEGFSSPISVEQV